MPMAGSTLKENIGKQPINFEVVEQECLINKENVLHILESCNNITDCELKFVEYCNLGTENYDLIALHHFDDENLYDNQYFELLRRAGYFGYSGLNLNNGHLLLFAYGSNKEIGYLIHETMHSFGMVDLYLQNDEPTSYYQERDCLLSRAWWSEFRNYPHLCSLEAEIVGWN